jgi:outer membrane receptor protein involved in Fe transport
VIVRLVVVALATLSCVAARAGELGESTADPSAFSTVIDARQYDERFTTVEQLLDQTPGVRVSRYGGLGAYSTASIRASKPEQVLVLLDGVRMNSAERGGFDLSTLPVRQIERIEVLRGAGAQRYGSDAVGGVISITTRRPEEGDEPAADASLTAGSYETFGGDGSLSAANERARGLVSYSRLRSTNDFDFDTVPPVRAAGGGGGRPGATLPSNEPSEHQRLNAGFVEDSGLLRGGFDFGPHTRLDATLDLYRRDGGEAGGIWIQSMAPDVPDDVLSCTLPKQYDDRGLARVAFVDEALGSAGRFGAFELAASGRAENSKLQDPGSRCQLVSKLITGSDTSAWQERTSALDGEWRFPELHWFDGGLAFTGRSAASLRYDTVNPSGADDQRRTTVLLSLQPELALGGGLLRLFPALAWEQASTSSGLARSAAFQPLVAYAPHDETGWLPGIGAILQVAPGLRFKANWKRVFRRPTFVELFHPDWGTIRGNPTLYAEKGWNADAGFELAAPGAGFLRELRLEADVFQRELDQGIEWLLQTNRAFMPINIGPARVLGAEVSAGATLFEILSLDASYTYNHARYLGNGSAAVAFAQVDRRMAHVPENAVTGSAALQLGPARLFTDVRYESDVVIQVGSLRLVPAATQVDAGVTLVPAEIPGLGFFPARWSVTVQGLNLTGQQRYDSLGLPLPKDPMWLVRVRGATP